MDESPKPQPPHSKQQCSSSTARSVRRIAAADRRAGRDGAELGLWILPSLAPDSTISTKSGVLRKLHSFAPWLALALFVSMGGELALAYVATWLGVHGLEDVTPQALVAIGAAKDAAELCLALFGVYAILQAPLSSIGLWLPNVPALALGVAGGGATSLIVALFVRELRLQTSYNLQYEHYVLSQATGLIAVALFAVFIVFTPIVEEILFRGIVLEGLVNVTNGVVAVVVSSVIFASIHLTGGVAQTAGAFIVGLVFGWLYLRTRSIVPSSIAHIVYNAVAFYPVILYMVRANRF